MGKAIIVFANGSKSLARNNDDLMLRWHERKAIQAETIIEQHQRGIVIRDCSNPESYEQAKTWREELAKSQQAIHAQISVLRAENQTPLVKRQISQLRVAIQEIATQQSSLKTYLKDYSPKPLTQEQLEELHAQKHAQKLERIAQANTEERENTKRMHKILVQLYSAVVYGGDVEAALELADEYIPLDVKRKAVGD